MAWSSSVGDDMRIALARCRWLPILLTFVVAGCGGPQSEPTTVAAPATVGHPNFKGSTDWVFVSDPSTSEVYIYALPKLKLVEIVTGFTQPQGECSDNKGDVWVTDGSGASIYKLLHSGKIVGKLSDTYGVPEGCAWDPKTGNLAVMNLLGTSSQPGAVLVYHHATGVPNLYSNPKQYNYDFGGYDNSGNLFFDGRTVQNKFILSELSVNAHQAKTITVSGGKIYTPGMVQWEASTSQLTIGDQNCKNATVSCIYQLMVAKNAGTIKGQINLENASGGQACDVIQAVLWKKSIIGSDFDLCGSAASTTYVWPYPGGGQPIAQNHRNDSEPFGTAVSSQTKGGDL
jgi:hypothetical protein